MFLGVSEKSQELRIGTPEGVVKSHEFRRKGSEPERWNMEEITAMKGVPWQPGPSTAGMEVQARIMVPMSLPDSSMSPPEVKPLIARGIAVKRKEYLKMGPTPGCYGCRCIVRGDKDHKPHNLECRERVIEWVKRQDDPNIQARLASAQLRMESQTKSQSASDAKLRAGERNDPSSG